MITLREQVLAQIYTNAGASWLARLFTAASEPEMAIRHVILI